MAEFLTTSLTIAYIERLIEDSKSKLVFITPYVQISETICQRMQDASKRRVDMTFVYGKGDLKNEEYANLKKIPGLKLSYFENLHAKCYYNEDRMIITSMNLYEFSAKNREMGVLLEKKIDRELFEKAVSEAESIINHSQQKNLSNSINVVSKSNLKDERNLHANKVGVTDIIKAKKKEGLSIHSNKGMCIRCNTMINFDPTKPYCAQCYSSWSKYENPDYPEAHCHACSRQPVETSMAKPFCYSCYKKFS